MPVRKLARHRDTEDEEKVREESEKSILETYIHTYTGLISMAALTDSQTSMKNPESISSYPCSLTLPSAVGRYKNDIWYNRPKIKSKLSFLALIN